jgi:hypothetical protein
MHVPHVGDPIPITITVPPVPDAVPVSIVNPPICNVRVSILGVANAIAVAISVLGVADAVPISIVNSRVWDVRVSILGVANAIAIAIPVAAVTNPVPVAVPRYPGTVLIRRGHRGKDSPEAKRKDQHGCLCSHRAHDRSLVGYPGVLPADGGDERGAVKADLTLEKS